MVTLVNIKNVLTTGSIDYGECYLTLRENGRDWRRKQLWANLSSETSFARKKRDKRFYSRYLTRYLNFALFYYKILHCRKAGILK